MAVVFDPSAHGKPEHDWCISPDIIASDDSLPDGGYIAETRIPVHDLERQYVAFPFGIAAGPLAERHANRSGECVRQIKYLSYKPQALKMTALALQAFANSNEGFDAFGAWNRGAFNEFAGKLIGLVVSSEEVRDRYDGRVVRRPVYKFASLDALRSGDYMIPGEKRLDGSFGEFVQGDPVEFGPECSHGGSPDEDLWGSHERV